MKFTQGSSGARGAAEAEGDLPDGVDRVEVDDVEVRAGGEVDAKDHGGEHTGDMEGHLQ